MVQAEAMAQGLGSGAGNTADSSIWDLRRNR